MARNSIRRKVSILTFVLAVVFCAMVGAFTFFYLRNNLVSSRVESIKKIANEQIHETLANFRNYQLFAKMLGTRTRVMEYMLDKSEERRIELDGILKEYTLADDNILSIYLMDEKGGVLISTDQTFIGQNYNFRNYFKKAFAGEPFIETALGKTSNHFGFYFSHPVRDRDGKTLGVLVVKVDGKYFDNPLLQSELSKDNTIMLTDEKGVIMVSNRAERFLSSLGPLTEVEKEEIKVSNQFLGKEIRSLQYQSVREVILKYASPTVVTLQDKEDNNETESLYIVKIEGLPFFLVVEISLDSIENSTLVAVLTIFFAIFLAALVIIAFSYRFLYRYVYYPIKQMEEAAGKITAGEMGIKIDINADDEMGDLAKAFNLMSSRLEKNYEELEKQIDLKTNEAKEKNESLNEQQKAVLNILEDVETEKSRAEQAANDLEKFKMAVENASDHIVITDPEGIVLYANKAAERITGYKISEVLGKKAAVLWKLPMPKIYYEKMWDTIKNKKQIFVGEINNVRKNKEEYIAGISIAPVLDKQKNIIFFVDIERDITREKQVDKAKTEFVSLASHQLRTPLSTINWYTEMLLNGDAGKLKSEQISYLEEIYRGNQRMVDLVNSLLNVSRLELGTFMVEPVECNLREVVDSVIGDLKLKIKDRKQDFVLNYDDSLPLIKLDKKLMHMIVENLLSNAVKYTPEKGKISMTVQKVGKNFEIIVVDSGLGIPASQQDKIFTKLFRADNVRSTDTEGTGLGLYLVKSILEHSGGNIRFESVENKGTTFFVKLPLSGMIKKEGDKPLS